MATVLQLRQLLDELAVFQKHVVGFDAEIKNVFLGESHPEARLFQDLPGAGPQLAPRLCAFGHVRSVYPRPGQPAKIRGPRRRSGKKAARNSGRIGAGENFPVFLRQTFVEWRPSRTVRHSAWAKVYYERNLKQGKKHPAILRALAFKWMHPVGLLAAPPAPTMKPAT